MMRLIKQTNIWQENVWDTYKLLEDLGLIVVNFKHDLSTGHKIQLDFSTVNKKDN